MNDQLLWNLVSVFVAHTHTMISNFSHNMIFPLMVTWTLPSLTQSGKSSYSSCSNEQTVLIFPTEGLIYHFHLSTGFIIILFLVIHYQFIYITVHIYILHRQFSIFFLLSTNLMSNCHHNLSEPNQQWTRPTYRYCTYIYSLAYHIPICCRAPILSKKKKN